MICHDWIPTAAMCMNWRANLDESRYRQIVNAFDILTESIHISREARDSWPNCPRVDPPTH